MSVAVMRVAGLDKFQTKTNPKSGDFGYIVLEGLGLVKRAVNIKARVGTKFH